MKLYADEQMYRGYIISPGMYGKFTFYHEDYDGPEDNRSGFGSTVQDCKDWIDELIEERRMNSGKNKGRLIKVIPYKENEPVMVRLHKYSAGIATAEDGSTFVRIRIYARWKKVKGQWVQTRKENIPLSWIRWENLDEVAEQSVEIPTIKDHNPIIDSPIFKNNLYIV